MDHQKNYTTWHRVKSKLNISEENIFFREREIWFCSLGCNIGCEQEGRGEEFLRPAVIVKKYGRHTSLVVPLTSTEKEGAYYFTLPDIKGKKNTALLSQGRIMDSKRFKYKLRVLEKSIFYELKDALKKSIFS